MSGRAIAFPRDSQRRCEESAPPEVVIVGGDADLSDAAITALAALLLAAVADGTEGRDAK